MPYTRRPRKKPRPNSRRLPRPHPRNVGALAAIPEITEFNIGHNIISRAVFVGLDSAVREMIEAIQN